MFIKKWLYHNPSRKYTIIYIFFRVSNLYNLNYLQKYIFLIRNLSSSIVSISLGLISGGRFLGSECNALLKALGRYCRILQKDCTSLQPHQQSLRDIKGPLLVSGSWWNSPFWKLSRGCKGFLPRIQLPAAYFLQDNLGCIKEASCLKQVLRPDTTLNFSIILVKPQRHLH